MAYIGKKPTDVPLSSADIADDAIDSDAYVDGSIDNAHIADDAIDSEHYADGSIDNAHIADDAIDSEHYVDGSVDLAHLSADSVDGTKIADNAIDSEHYTDASIDLAHMSVNSIDSDQYVDGSIDNAHLADDAVGVAELSATGTASSSTFLRGDNSWAAAGAVATSFIGGLTISNNGSDAAHDIDIAVGSARDYTDAVTMTQGTAGLTKRIDATWAVGDGNGGLDSTDTVANNTGYGVYLIRRSDTGVVDVLISTDMTAAGSALTMPTSYNQKRLIGWVRTDGSANILTFTQSGDYFRLTGVIVQEVYDTTITSLTSEDLTMTTPPLCLAHIYGQTVNGAGSFTVQSVFIKTKGATDAGNFGSQPSTFGWSYAQSASAFLGTGSQGFIMTNASSVIEYACLENDAASSISIRIFGCNMLTRSNP